MIRRVGILLLTVLFASAPAHAQSTASAGGTGKAAVSYAAGGIGIDEMQKLQARENEFNLKLVCTLVEGNYVSDVEVAVKDAAGQSLLTLTAQGPVVLARLPHGSYVVEATYDGKTQTRNVKLGDRLRTEYLRWPSNPETDFPGPKATEK